MHVIRADNLGYSLYVNSQWVGTVVLGYTGIPCCSRGYVPKNYCETSVLWEDEGYISRFQNNTQEMILNRIGIYNLTILIDSGLVLLIKLKILLAWA